LAANTNNRTAVLNLIVLVVVLDQYILDSNVSEKDEGRIDQESNPELAGSRGGKQEGFLQGLPLGG
jgi:hypothetical protein